MEQGPRPPLIEPEELAGLLDAPAAQERPAVLDIRWSLGGPPGRDDYLAGHIPGAAFLDLDAQLAGPPGSGGRHPLPQLESFTAAMREAGVSHGRSAVVYDAATSMAAARGWWLLRYFGHPDVRVLNGGLAAWRVAGHPLEAGDEQPPRGDFVARPGSMPVLDAAGAAQLAAAGVLLDARAAERFRGEQEPIDPVAGHIPGARNHPSTENLESSGRFRTRPELRAGFRQAGVAEDVPVGAYCGSGVTAAHQVLALEVAGFPAALYVGSWSEWITDPLRPVAVGE